MTERRFHLIFIFVVAGMTIVGVAQGKGKMLHADQQCATEVLTK